MASDVSTDHHLTMSECGPVLRALGDPVRLRIIDLLRDGERPVSGVADALELAHYQASRHLSVLHGLGLLARRQQSRQVLYRLALRLLSDQTTAPTIDLGCCSLRISGNR